MTTGGAGVSIFLAIVGGERSKVVAISKGTTRR
jgi:hypothetical protein